MDEEKEDRISLLPDCLLIEIISRLELSTKQVIKTTSTISKRWQHLWTKLPTLVFIYEDDVPNLRYDLTDYNSFIDKTLTQCPTDVNLNKFKVIIGYHRLVYTPSKSLVYSWIRHAITRNVQEVDLLIRYENIYDDELFFNNSCLISMKLSCCVFSPPNGAIRWDKLKCLRIDDGKLDEDSIGKILSGSPSLETLEMNYCYPGGCIWKSLFGNFGVERLSCEMESYEWFTNGDERFWDDLRDMSLKLSRCVLNPPNGWGNLNFLCIDYGEIDEDSIGKILSRSPCLETLELDGCYGVRRIDVASNSVKNLVFSTYGYAGAGYIDTLEIDAPFILSLTIKGTLYLEKILLLNISSLVKAELDYVGSDYLAEKLGRTLEDIEDELLKGLLINLGHVNEITLRNNCLKIEESLIVVSGIIIVKSIRFRCQMCKVTKISFLLISCRVCGWLNGSGTESSHVNGFFTSSGPATLCAYG
ncbi:ribonuclease H-like domain-containing protein [Tanacetum coccineum]